MNIHKKDKNLGLAEIHMSIPKTSAEMEKTYKIALTTLQACKISTQIMSKACSKSCKNKQKCKNVPKSCDK